DRLGLTGSVVFFNEGWVPYEERSRWLTDADLGVSCHFEHLETAFSFRTRMLDYLWAGLPIVATDGDVFADLIRTRGLGRVVDPEDVDGLAAALQALLGDAAELAHCRAQVRALADELRWDRLAEPLLEFCRRPRRAPDHAVSRPVVPGPGSVSGRRSLPRAVATAARTVIRQGATRRAGPG
ncbi:MAG TPA: glycosyltransferase, partial [Mycobacteriales bacterium]